MDPMDPKMPEQRSLAVRDASLVAAAEQARVAVQARYQVAISRPRDIDTVRVRLMAECKRPRFAAVARYTVPRGKNTVSGPSIRFAEAALRCLGNVYPEVTTVYDDDEKRIVRVAVMDLESNLTYSRDISIAKTTERRQLRPGEQPLSTRTGSTGHTVYLVRATEDDLANRESALVSKVLRGHALRILPGDILDECMDAVQRTLAAEDARDPAEARKRIVDAFAAQGVAPAELAEYLGHSLESCAPAELATLREVYTAVRDGHARWHEVLADVREARKPATAETRGTGTDALKAKMRAKSPPPPSPAAPLASDDDAGDLPPPEHWEQVAARVPGSDG